MLFAPNPKGSCPGGGCPWLMVSSEDLGAGRPCRGGCEHCSRVPVLGVSDSVKAYDNLTIAGQV